MTLAEHVESGRDGPCRGGAAASCGAGLAIAAKRAALSSTSTFRQEIVGDIAISVEGESMMARFRKRSGSAAKMAEVQARLGLLRGDRGLLVIVEETDDPTESRLAVGKPCHNDADCTSPQFCMFVAGETYVCSTPKTPKPCPRGKVFRKSDGECWVTCKTDADCGHDMCCTTDPNAPTPICMARCI